MPLYTKENAMEMAERSKRARAARRLLPKPETPPTAQSPEQATNPPTIDIAPVRSHLERISLLMTKAKTDREWDNLSRAYERVFKVWMVLSKTPLPGSRKPLPERSRPANGSDPLEG